MERGELVSDELMIELIRERLAQSDAAAGFILDGFPRTLVQAEELEETLRGIGSELDAVVVLEVPDAIATERMVARGREDDTPEAIATRLENYHRETAPLVEWYRARDKVIPIDGTVGIDEVWEQIDSQLMMRNYEGFLS
jgi:adenylate kinase